MDALHAMRVATLALVFFLVATAALFAQTVNWNYPAANFNLLTGSSSTTVSGVTVTTSASATGSFTTNAAQILPAGASNGSSTGIIQLNMDATTENLSSFQTVTITFSEPVYNLAFTVLDIDGGPAYTAGNWNDTVDFSSDNGAPTAVITNASWVGYNTGTGRATAISNQNAVSGAANQANGNIRVTYPGPVNSITIRHYSDQVPTGTNPSGQVIFIDDLSFRRAPRLAVRKTSTGGVGTFAYDITNGPTGTISTSVTTVTAGTSVTGTQFRLGATNTATTVTETGPAGWSISTANATCADANSAASGNPASFTTPVTGFAFTVPATNIRPGAELTCSITNDKRPTVQLQKITQGGTGSFSFSGTNGFGSDTIATVTPGVAVAGTTRTLTAVATSTTITETVPAGWQAVSGTCTGTAAANVTFATPTSTTATITLNTTATAAANALVCTFTNRLIPTVSVQKLTAGAASSPASFSFTNTGLTGSFPAIATTSAGVAQPASPAALNGTVGTGVTISESAVASGYVAAGASCTDANASVTGNATPITSTTASVTIPAGNMVAGARYTCVFTNNRLPTITLTKVSNGGIGGFTFTGTNGWTSQTITTTVAGTGVTGATQTLTAVSTATTITETIPAGWQLVSVSCTGTGGGTQPTVNTTTGAIDFTAAQTAPGSNIACTVTNGLIAYTVAKSASTANISAPGTITYTMTVTNTGGAFLTGTTFSDSLAQGVTPKTLTTGPAFVSGDVANAGVFDPGEAWVYTATYNVSQAEIDNGGTFANIFTFDTAQSSPQNSNTALTTVTRTPNLTVLKRVQTGTPTPLTAGQSVTFEYVVTNTGNVTISSVGIQETAFNGTGGTGALTPAGGSASLAPGASTTFTASYTVTQNDVDTLQ